MRGLALYFLFIMALCCTVTASASGKYLYINTNIGLKQALLHGNIAYIKKQSQTAKYEMQRKIAHLAYLQSQRRLSEVFRKGKACFEEEKNQNIPSFAILCGVLAASAALSEQRVGSWARLAVEIDAYGLPAVEKTTGKRWKMPYFYDLDVNKFTHIPSMVVANKGKHLDFIPWVHCSSHFGSMVLIQVNHKSVCAIVDTGSNSFVLSPQVAKELGLKIYAWPYITKSSSIPGKAIPTRLGLAKSMEIGNVTFLNMPVTIEQISVNVIGSNILQLLGNVLFTNGGLEINPAQPAMCKQPMAYAYKNLITPTYPVLSAYVDHRPVRLVFDSGFAAPLFTNSTEYITNKKQLSKRKYRISNGSYSMMVHSTKATFNINSSGKSIMIPMLYASNYQEALPLKAGRDILKRYNVALNFDAHTACFLPAG